MADILSTSEPSLSMPSSAKEWTDFYNDWGREKYDGNWQDANPEHWFIKNGPYNWVTGHYKQAREAYENYLSNLNNRNEWIATQNARAWDKYLSDTQYQRMVKDLEKAGLNPWLAVQNSLSGSSVPSSGKANYSVEKLKNDKSTAGKDVALLVLAIARVIAAL